MELGKALRAFRRAKGLTQDYVSEVSGLCLNTIRRVEAGKQFPYRYTVNQWLKALDVSESEVLLYAICDEDVPDSVKEKAQELREEILKNA